MTTLNLICTFLSVLATPARTDVVALEYIRTYKELAKTEMHLYGIPASIKLAQALIESDAGTSVLATRANNHFGIKCKSWWTGSEYFYADDDYDENGDMIASCFRSYDSAELSFTDHSVFLTTSDRYLHLFSYGLDYHKWAYGLQYSGYATSTTYAKQLIQVIEKYELHGLDKSP
jgi:flagellum-specific peptidoglycan hydrolase FlgJ